MIPLHDSSHFIGIHVSLLLILLLYGDRWSVVYHALILSQATFVGAEVQREFTDVGEALRAV